MKEVLDVVDAHDEIVGQADRSDVHKNGLLHRVVHVMVFDPDGRLFMQQRALSKDRYPGYWEGSLSGHVKSRETFKEAAERELHEELNICATPKRVKEVIKFGLHEGDERVLTELYALKDFKSGIEFDEDEVKSGEFWAMKKLDDEIKAGKKPFHPLFLKALKEFRAMKETTKEFL